MSSSPLSRPKIDRRFLWAGVALLLVFWGTRIVAIDQFPMFTDEAFHVRYARNVVEKRPLYRAEAGCLFAGRSHWVRWGALGAILILGLVGWLLFAATLYTNPASLSFSADEYQQYVASEGSGSGLAALAATLADLEPQAVLGIFANCWVLDYMVGDDLPLECQSINPDGSTVSALADLMASRRAEGMYAGLEDLAYLPDDVPGRLVATTARPASGPALEVDHLAPN